MPAVWRSKRSAASRLALNTSRELAGSLGIAVLGAILAARQSASLSHGATAQAAFVSGYSLALVIGAAITIAGAIIAAIVLRAAVDHRRAGAQRE